MQEQKECVNQYGRALTDLENHHIDQEQAIQKNTDVLIHKGFKGNSRKTSDILRFLIFGK
jgi:hypothetical protein